MDGGTDHDSTDLTTQFSGIAMSGIDQGTGMSFAQPVNLGPTAPVVGQLTPAQSWGAGVALAGVMYGAVTGNTVMAALSAATGAHDLLSLLGYAAGTSLSAQVEMPGATGVADTISAGMNAADVSLAGNMNSVSDFGDPNNYGGSMFG